MNGAQEMLAQLCADLRLPRAEAGGPSVRLLGERIRVSKSQVGAIPDGQVRELPDRRVVTGLVESFVQYAQEHRRTGRLSLPTGVEEFWRHRYAMVEHAFRQEARHRGVAVPDSGTRPASGSAPGSGNGPRVFGTGRRHAARQIARMERIGLSRRHSTRGNPGTASAPPRSPLPPSRARLVPPPGRRVASCRSWSVRRQ